MYPTDVAYIEGEPTEEKILYMIKNLYQRDSLMGMFIIEKFNEMKNENPKQKALVIMNDRHALKVKIDDNNNVGMFLAKEYTEKVANVLINAYDTYERDWVLQDGRWDAAFKVTKKEDVGFDFRGSPFGDCHFDYIPSETNKKYSDVFDGFVFYKPIEKFQLAVGLPGLMDDGFLETTIKEIELFQKVFHRHMEVDEEELKHYNDLHFEPILKIDEIKRKINKWLE